MKPPPLILSCFAATALLVLANVRETVMLSTCVHTTVCCTFTVQHLLIDISV